MDPVCRSHRALQPTNCRWFALPWKLDLRCLRHFTWKTRQSVSLNFFPKRKRIWSPQISGWLRFFLVFWCMVSQALAWTPLSKWSGEHGLHHLLPKSQWCCWAKRSNGQTPGAPKGLNDPTESFPERGQWGKGFNVMILANNQDQAYNFYWYCLWCPIFLQIPSRPNPLLQSSTQAPVCTQYLVRSLPLSLQVSQPRLHMLLHVDETLIYCRDGLVEYIPKEPLTYRAKICLSINSSFLVLYNSNLLHSNPCQSVAAYPLSTQVVVQRRFTSGGSISSGACESGRFACLWWLASDTYRSNQGDFHKWPMLFAGQKTSEKATPNRQSEWKSRLHLTHLKLSKQQEELFAALQFAKGILGHWW